MTPKNSQKEHNYLIKLRQMLAAGQLPDYVGVHDIDVYHDTWCAIHTGGLCNCDPDIKIRRVSKDE
jgi:hypothetical protein